MGGSSNDHVWPFGGEGGSKISKNWPHGLRMTPKVKNGIGAQAHIGFYIST